MLVFLKLISRIPFWILYPITEFLSVLARSLYRPKVVYGNLKLAFPDKSEKEIKLIKKQFYRNLFHVIIEILKSTSLSADDLRKRAKLSNPEVIESMYQQGKSVMIFAAHFGNWEWISHAVALGTSFNTVSPIYKTLSNKVFDQFMFKIRSMHGGKPLQKEQALRNILKNKELTRAVGMVGDQRPFVGGSKLWIKFMGNETAFFPGINTIPYLTQFDCYYLKSKRVRRGYYEIEAIPIGKAPFKKGETNVLLNYAKEMEKQLNSNPEDWLWTHKRWKYVRSNDEELLS